MIAPDRKNRFGQRVILGLLLIVWVAPLSAQLKIVQGKSGEEIIENYFAGEMVKVRNVLFKGNPLAIDAFSSANGKPHFQSGFILSTGTAADAASPNNKAKLSGRNDTPGDRTLDALSNNRTFDGASIEFDFMAARDSVSLRFFFASEEYNEFVGKDFGDVFSIFVTGPGLGRGVHLARLESGEPISVNTVNYNKNRSDFVDNNPFDLNGRRLATAEAKLDPQVLKHFQYDGMTVAFARGLKVKPKEVYHLRITIADAGDNTIDSAVLMEAGSFKSEEQLWRIRRREAIERQRVADSIAAAKAYQDSLLAVARLDSIRMDSIRAAEAAEMAKDSLEAEIDADPGVGTPANPKPDAGALGPGNTGEIRVHEPGDEEEIGMGDPGDGRALPAKVLIGFPEGKINIPDKGRMELRNLALYHKDKPETGFDIFVWGKDDNASLRANSVKFYLEGAGVRTGAARVYLDPPRFLSAPARPDGASGSFIQIIPVR